jgi:hypothetical protein
MTKKQALPSQQQAAQDLVKRARYGDENAMAIIANVGKNARAGHTVAKSAYSYILDFIKRNPAPSPMGAEECNYIGVFRAAGDNDPGLVARALCTIPASGNPDLISASIVALSNSCPWDKNRVSTYDSIFGGEANRYWRFGYAFSGSPELQKHRFTGPEIGVVCAGPCIGTARKIQLARLKGMPISVLGKQVGWEFGLG